MFWVYGGKKSPNTKITVNRIEDFRQKYKLILVDDNPAAKALLGSYGQTEPPAVFWNNTYIGGYKETQEYLLQQANS
jgi:glutaredoxin